MIVFALALLVLGALVGARGLRGVGRLVRGPWRPGAGVLGALLLLAALLLAARSQWAIAVVLLIAGAGALGAARFRRPPPPKPVASGMSRREAATLLGVAPDAPPADVEAAYRRLMRLAHPDTGGTAGLAAQLNAARAVLLATMPHDSRRPRT